LCNRHTINGKTQNEVKYTDQLIIMTCLTDKIHSQNKDNALLEKPIRDVLLMV